MEGAVSVATAEDLAQRDVRTVQDLQNVFPNLTIDSRGNRAYANFTVRGISSPDYYNPGVQVYVDGVPQPAAAMTQELVDVERVEFLRGPQGTLYGRNAFAGVINIVTAKPRETRMKAFGTVSNHLFIAGASATATVVPETVFFDVSIKGTYDNGQIDDVDVGEDNIDWWNAVDGRAAVRYAPTGGPFDSTIWVSGEHLRSREETYVLDQDFDAQEYQSAVLGPYSLLSRDVVTGGINWNYRFGAFTLTNTTSYEGVDLDRTIFSTASPESTRTFYEELRLAYDAGGAFTAVAGATYWNEEFARDTGGYTGYYANARNDVTSRSAALFGEGTYSLTDRIDLTLGLRASYDWSSIDYSRPDIYGNGMGFAIDESANYSSLQPKASIGFQVTETARLYALVSEGYKPGGFNHTIATPQDGEAYDPETAWNFEVGGRASVFDGRLDLSGAVYYIRSQDKQVYVGILPNQVIENVGDATSTGVELSATVHPTDRLQITANGSFGRSEFDGFVDPYSGVSYSDNRVPYAPDVTANLAARYILPQTWIPADVAVTGAAHYVSKTYFNEANTLSQPAYATFDAGLEFAFDTGQNLRFFVDNIADEVYRTSSFDFNGNTISTVDGGRLFGVSFDMTF
ncbi:TonB-dependent receptor [Amorphus sp. 3PC139-8]|uniref:TonB-dependent receptor n=1 Tax=Amorphus sp. 3PC139-8 TaxID=2735676 RepID=UPI00345D35C4